MSTVPEPGEVELDVARWPLLVLRYPAHLSEHDVPRLYARWEKLFPRGRHAVLCDMRAFQPLRVTPMTRRRMADEVERRRDDFERLLLAEARVVPNPVTRGVVTAFDWVVGSTFSRPLRNVGTFAEAESFLQSECTRRGAPFPIEAP